jgi:hypothetical protein
MLSLLDRPSLRRRVSAVMIDLSQLDDEGRILVAAVLARAGAIGRLRSPQLAAR